MATTSQVTGQAVPTAERRAFARCKVEPLIYVNFGPDNGGILLDICEGGLSCRVVGALIKGETYKPKFILPGTNATIEADCIAKWTTPSKKSGGLHFVDLPRSARLSIRQWIEREAAGGSGRTVVMATKMSPIQLKPNPPANRIAAGPSVHEPAERLIEGLHAPPRRARTQDSSAASGVHPAAVGYQREKDALSQPSRPGFQISASRIAICLGFLVAIMILAFYSGRLIGFATEAAKVDGFKSRAAAVETNKPSGIAATPPIRKLDPPVAVADSQPSVDASAISKRSVAESKLLRALPAGKAPTKTNVAAQAQKVVSQSSVNAMSLRPPHAGAGVGTGANSNDAALAEITPPNSMPFVAGSLAVAPLDHPEPARPQTAASVATTFHGPVLVQRVEPTYTSFARQSGVEGAVQVRAIVGKDGVPRDLEVVKGDLRLATSALDAIRKWRYQPALSGSTPIEAPVTITIEFRIR